jgi:hypothetical protein
VTTTWAEHGDPHARLIMPSRSFICDNGSDILAQCNITVTWEKRKMSAENRMEMGCLDHHILKCCLVSLEVGGIGVLRWSGASGQLNHHT